MALRRDPSGSVLCSQCDSPVQSKWSLAGLIAVVRTTDVFAWVLAGVFVLLGLVWPPGYLVAGLAVGFALFKELARRPRYVCSSCKRAFTFEEIHGD